MLQAGAALLGAPASSDGSASSMRIPQPMPAGAAPTAQLALEVGAAQ